MKERASRKSRKFFRISQFIAFFIMMSFVVSCNFFLFFSFVDMKPEQIREAAPITFINVIIITIMFCVIDTVRRQWTIERPMNIIQEAIEHMMKGDFSRRIHYESSTYSAYEFDRIIEGLNQMAEELGSVETLRTDFIANVSHELKTPLSVIQHYGTLLQSTNIGQEEHKAYSKIIVEQTKRLSNLITNILKLNRLENQKILPDAQAYNLTEQICECMLGFEDVWEKKDLEIDTELEDSVYICYDAELMSLVWNNLISNAIKFTDTGGKIKLYLKESGDYVMVSIEDTGCGITKEVGKHIFDKFYQGDTSHATQGNGLGLALVKRVIDIVGGEITVKSVLGEGSTFTVVLKKDRSSDDVKSTSSRR